MTILGTYRRDQPAHLKIPLAATMNISHHSHMERMPVVSFHSFSEQRALTTLGRIENCLAYVVVSRVIPTLLSIAARNGDMVPRLPGDRGR